ncbi:hypothetical protein [Streptomyces sp. WAC00263]|uniref:hypothetical protein n=1 Tax=Streptomyces sp. WAC00263 TaxID=1917422 RepID=UPI0015EE77F1|nr:hypothetical protein [Streptomyces sp. WAC00263]KAF5990753.1 hypothetical protein BOG92_000965 [Streptomyces sp. WAC00263]
MRTTLTPQFWEMFTVLLVAAMGVTFVVAAALDALVVRLRRRRAGRPRTEAPSRSTSTDGRMPVGR